MRNEVISKKDWHDWLKWVIPLDIIWQLLFFSAVFVLQHETFINFRQMTPEKWIAMTEVVVPKKPALIDFFLSLISFAQWVIGILFVVTLVVYAVLQYQEQHTIWSKPMALGGAICLCASAAFYVAFILPVVEYPAIYEWMAMEFVSLWLVALIIEQVRRLRQKSA